MTKTPRWLKSVIAASSQPQPALPFARSERRKPESVKTPTLKLGAIAAR